jgi:methanogenic corrinoid protein MtbC1
MSRIGRNIKFLRGQKRLNQSELGELLGVSQTTIAHYEAGTREPNIESLQALSRIFEQSIDSIIGNINLSSGEEKSFSDFDSLYNELLQAGIEKDDAKVVALFKNDVIGVYTIEEIIESFISSILYQVGEMWNQGVITEADEHYATNLLRKVIGYISIDNAGTLKDKVAVTMSIGSEKHTFGIEMVSTYLELQGVKTIYLGNSLPFKTFEGVLQDYEPDYIFLSITMSDHENHLIALIEYIEERFPGQFIIGVGGQGIEDESILSKHENVYYMESISSLNKYIK